MGRMKEMLDELHGWSPEDRDIDSMLVQETRAKLASLNDLIFELLDRSQYYGEQPKQTDLIEIRARVESILRLLD